MYYSTDSLASLLFIDCYYQLAYIRGIKIIIIIMRIVRA